VQVWLDDKEYQHFVEQVEKTYFTQSGCLRGLIDGFEVQPRAPEGYAKLLTFVSEMSNNVDKVVHLARATQSVNMEQVTLLQTMMREIFNALRNLTGLKMPDGAFKE